MSLDAEMSIPAGLRFPRVSGDEPNPGGEVLSVDEFSPRERG